MATRAFGGMAAGLGLMMLGIATATTIVMAVYHAKAKRIKQHQTWATRCFILLCSPLLLRMVMGLISVLGMESILTHQFIAWASWMVPIAIFEYRQKKSEPAKPAIRSTPNQLISNGGIQ